MSPTLEEKFNVIHKIKKGDVISSKIIAKEATTPVQTEDAQNKDTVSKTEDKADAQREEEPVKSLLFDNTSPTKLSELGDNLYVPNINFMSIPDCPLTTSTGAGDDKNVTSVDVNANSDDVNTTSENTATTTTTTTKLKLKPKKKKTAKKKKTVKKKKTKKSTKTKAKSKLPSFKSKTSNTFGFAYPIDVLEDTFDKENTYSYSSSNKENMSHNDGAVNGGEKSSLSNIKSRLARISQVDLAKRTRRTLSEYNINSNTLSSNSEHDGLGKSAGGSKLKLRKPSYQSYNSASNFSNAKVSGAYEETDKENMTPAANTASSALFKYMSASSSGSEKKRKFEGGSGLGKGLKKSKLSLRNITNGNTGIPRPNSRIPLPRY